MLVRALIPEESNMLLQLLDTRTSWGRRLSGLVVGQVGRTSHLSVQLMQRELTSWKEAKNPTKTTIERETHARGNRLQRDTGWAIALTHDLEGNGSKLKVFLASLGCVYDSKVTDRY